MVRLAGQYLATPWDDRTDAQLAQMLLGTESHLQKIHLMQEEILRDLDQIRADKEIIVATRNARGHPPLG